MLYLFLFHVQCASSFLLCKIYVSFLCKYNQPFNCLKSNSIFKQIKISTDICSSLYMKRFQIWSFISWTDFCYAVFFKILWYPDVMLCPLCFLQCNCLIFISGTTVDGWIKWAAPLLDVVLTRLCGNHVKRFFAKIK